MDYRHKVIASINCIDNDINDLKKAMSLQKSSAAQGFRISVNEIAEAIRRINGSFSVLEKIADTGN